MSMVTLRLKNIELGKNVDWVYTNWEIGTSKNFDESKLVFTSYEDRVNKAVIIKELTLLPGTKYYSRAQVVTNKGAHEWTNLDTWEHKAYDQVENQSDLPTLLVSPHVYTDSQPEEHTPTGFYILTHDYGATTDSTHVATSYWIEEMDGTVVWKDMYNETSRYKILVDDIILDTDKCYRVKAVFHSSSNDTSQIATKTIYVRGTRVDVNASRIATTIKDSDLSVIKDIETLLYIPKDKSGAKAKVCEVKILAYLHSGSAPAFEASVDLTKNNPVFAIPSDKLKTRTVYLVFVRYDINNKWSHMLFHTY